MFSMSLEDNQEENPQENQEKKNRRKPTKNPRRKPKKGRGEWETGRCVTRSGTEIPIGQIKDYTKKDVTPHECKSICYKYKRAKGCGFIQENKGDQVGLCSLFLVKVKNSKKKSR